MPTYAYVCADCGHAFDAVQSFTEDSLTTCPQCSGRLRKQFGAVGVVFKGSGFYKTDSRTSSDKGAGNSSSSSSSGNGSSSNGSSGASSDGGGSTSSSSSSESSTSSGASSTSSTAS